MAEFNNLSETDEKDLRIKELEYELGELRAQTEEMDKWVHILRGEKQVLADKLAKYNGITTPETLKWSEEQV